MSAIREMTIREYAEQCPLTMGEMDQRDAARAIDHMVFGLTGWPAKKWGPRPLAQWEKQNIECELKDERLDEWREQTGKSSLGMFSPEGATCLHLAIDFAKRTIKDRFMGSLTDGQYEVLEGRIQRVVAQRGHSEVYDTAVRESIWWALKSYVR